MKDFLLDTVENPAGFFFSLIVGFLLLHLISSTWHRLSFPVFERIIRTKTPLLRKRYLKLSTPWTGIAGAALVLTLKQSIGQYLYVQNPGFYRIIESLLIASAALLIVRAIKIGTEVLYQRLDIKIADNLYQRKVVTQIQFVERVVFIAILVVALGLILMRSDRFEKLGGSLLASAGIMSIIIGLAAQETVSNLLAGFQIAFTQPIRIDDAVVVENEWGWIEEITLTYVVVRIWDKRRLVLPIKYFVSKPFQNWTRNDAHILGTVVFYLDYAAPIEPIRGKFEELVKASPHWDGKTAALQVIDATERTLQIRGLVSATDSSKAWDLRCDVREKLIAYIQKEFPEALPRVRSESSHIAAL